MFLAQPEPLEQGQDKIESASEVKTHRAIAGQYLKKCSLTELVINDIWSSAEGKNGWSYILSPLVPVWCACGHLCFCLCILFAFHESTITIKRDIEHVKNNTSNSEINVRNHTR